MKTTGDKEMTMQSKIEETLARCEKEVCAVETLQCMARMRYHVVEHGLDMNAMVYAIACTALAHGGAVVEEAVNLDATAALPLTPAQRRESGIVSAATVTVASGCIG